MLEHLRIVYEAEVNVGPKPFQIVKMSLIDKGTNHPSPGTQDFLGDNPRETRMVGHLIIRVTQLCHLNMLPILENLGGR